MCQQVVVVVGSAARDVRYCIIVASSTLDAHKLKCNTNRKHNDYDVRILVRPCRRRGTACCCTLAILQQYSAQSNAQIENTSHYDYSVLFRIYHKGTANDKFELIQTRLLWVRLNNLTPNSQYIVYVVAQTRLGASLPSETLVAWTEPALSAFVDVSTSQ